MSTPPALGLSVPPFGCSPPKEVRCSHKMFVGVCCPRFRVRLDDIGCETEAIDFVLKNFSFNFKQDSRLVDATRLSSD